MFTQRHCEQFPSGWKPSGVLQYFKKKQQDISSQSAGPQVTIMQNIRNLPANHSIPQSRSTLCRYYDPFGAPSDKWTCNKLVLCVNFRLFLWLRRMKNGELYCKVVYEEIFWRKLNPEIQLEIIFIYDKWTYKYCKSQGVNCWMKCKDIRS